SIKIITTRVYNRLNNVHLLHWRILCHGYTIFTRQCAKPKGPCHLYCPQFKQSARCLCNLLCRSTYTHVASKVSSPFVCSTNTCRGFARCYKRCRHANSSHARRRLQHG